MGNTTTSKSDYKSITSSVIFNESSKDYTGVWKHSKKGSITSEDILNILKQTVEMKGVQVLFLQ